MSLITTSSVRARARRAMQAGFSFQPANVLLERHMQKQASTNDYDIFLSHAFDDKEIILGVALTLEDLGYTVYLDWRDDPALDRKNVNAATATKLRERMKNAKCLLYSTTENASSSRWMPWELGFKDGQSNRSAILPVKDTVPVDFRGQEYLALYPYITQQKDTQNTEQLWVRRSRTCYVNFDAWLRRADIEPYEHS